MKKDVKQTEVIFRKFKDNGDIIALFPYEINDFSGNVLSYMHVGQHSGAGLDLVRETEPVSMIKDADAFSLYKELVFSIGYKLKIITKVNHRKYRNRLDTFRKEHKAA